jgi:hypothetical protein
MCIVECTWHTLAGTAGGCTRGQVVDAHRDCWWLHTACTGTAGGCTHSMHRDCWWLHTETAGGCTRGLLVVAHTACMLALVVCRRRADV